MPGTDDTQWVRDEATGICYDKAGRRICGANKQNKDKTRRCMIHKGLDQNGRCHVHKGLPVAGPLHPAWKHGAYSRKYRFDLLEKVNAALENRELLSLRRDIAEIDAYIDGQYELLAGKADPVKQIAEAQKVYAAFKEAHAKQDLLGVMTHLEKLDTVLNEPAPEKVNDEAVYQRIFDAQERRRKLVDTERRLLMDLRQLVTAEQVLLHMKAVLAVVREYIADDRAWNACFFRLAELRVGGGPERLQPGDDSPGLERALDAIPE